MIRSTGHGRRLKGLGQTACLETFNTDTQSWELVAGSDPSCETGAGTEPYASGSGDSGEGAAVADFAAANTAAANQAALNASSPSSLVLAQSLMSGNIPSPLPGLGLTVPNPVTKWLLIAGIALAAVFVLSEAPAPARRSRK